MVVEDESHVWEGDSLGYVWGRRNERTKIPMATVKQRQPYYGVMNLYNQEFMVTLGEGGNGESTVSLLKEVQALHPAKKLSIIWDGASYHCSEAVQT